METEEQSTEQKIMIEADRLSAAITKIFVDFIANAENDLGEREIGDILICFQYLITSLLIELELSPKAFGVEATKALHESTVFETEKDPDLNPDGN